MKNGETFNMFESHAIMKYICASRKLPQHWYPTDDTDEAKRLRAQMDMYLDWHHGGMRMGAGAYFFRAYFSGFMDKNGVWSTEQAVQEAQ